MFRQVRQSVTDVYTRDMPTGQTARYICRQVRQSVTNVYIRDFSTGETARYKRFYTIFRQVRQSVTNVFILYSDRSDSPLQTFA